MSFLDGLKLSFGMNKHVRDLKKEFSDTFGGSNEPQDPAYLDNEPEVAYDKDAHQSWTAKRATAAREKSMANVKSDAVRAAMERRAAQQAAKAGGRR